MKKLRLALILLVSLLVLFSFAACDTASVSDDGDTEHTVTFLDETGAVLKTETVAHGGAATAPEAPVREDTVFKEWDTAFDKVESDLTVKAVYRDKETYTVTFKDYSGRLLGTASVKEGGSATLPTPPTRDGYTFVGWSDDLTSVLENKTVTAEYTLNEGTNLFDLSYLLADDGSVTLTASVKGSVCFAGVSGSMALPAEMTDVVALGVGSTAVNVADNTLYFIYGEAENTVEEIELFTLTFECEEESLTFEPVLESFLDASLTAVSYDVIGETVTLK